MSENEIPEGLLDTQITILDFYASWCGPCRSLIPILDELSEEYINDSTIKIIKINVDEQPAIATKFGVRSIPNVVFVKNGEVVNKFIGVKTKSDIKNIIEEVRSYNN
jgi:thioredoxin 1